MSARYFIDTNIFAYTFDNKSTQKQKKAMRLIRKGLTTGEGIISTQVIQEFCNIALKKFKTPMTPSELHLYLENVLIPLCKNWPSSPLYQKAIALQTSTKYGFYDALVIASALQEKCTYLYTEDLQHNQTIESLTIQNPFK
jgi:predicted nucleic acid-binding protein